MKKSLLRSLPLLLLFTGFVSAQTPSPTPAPSPVPRVYIPYDKLEEIFGKDNQGIFLPYGEFIDMWNKVNMAEMIKKTQPPVDGILASAHYNGKVTGDVVNIDAKLAFQSLKEGWSSLPLGTADLNVADAKTNATLTYADDGYRVIFPDKGNYDLDMTVYGKITKDEGRNSLKLTLPRTAVSQFEMIVPDKGLDFTITPACAFTTNEQADGTTKLDVFFGASQEVNISWQKRGGETALKPLLFVETVAETRLGAGAVHTVLNLNYRILRAGVSEFEVLIPNDQQVLSVDGQNLRDWSLGKEGDRQLLMVNLHSPARDNYAFRVDMEAPIVSLPAKALELPMAEVKNVERQTGVIDLTRDPELVAEIQKLDGLTQQLAGGGGAQDETRIGQYRYLRLPYTLSLNLDNAKPLIDVTSETLLTVMPENQTLVAAFNYDVKKAGIFSTRIELPDGFERAEATGEAVESSNVQKVGAKNVLEVKFNQRRIGQFSFQVTADATRKTPDEAVTIPVFNPLDVQRHEAKVGVAVHVSLKATTGALGDLRTEDIRNVGALRPENESVTPLTLGFRYRGGDVKTAQIAFELRKPRVSAEVLALMEVRESVIKNTWWIDYNVEYAGVNEFTLAVPKEIADDIQIDGANIKERTKSDDPTLKGMVDWKVSLQDKNLGAYELKISLERPRAQLNADQTATVSLPEIRPLDLFRETGQIAVLKDGNLEFTNKDTKGTDVIDPKELHGQLQQNGVFLAYKYSAHPVTLSLDVAKNLYLDVPTALVTAAWINTVIADDRSQTTEVVYEVRNNSQQFFTIRLPEGGKMLADVTVRNELQQPSKRPNQDEMLIRLPVQQGSDQTFAIRFIYEVPGPNAGRGLWPRGTIHVAPPVLTDAEIMQTQWRLYLPAGYRYVNFAGPMRESVSDKRGWDSFHDFFDRFVPNFGPAPAMNPPWANQVQALLQPAVAQNGGVDFVPTGVHPVILHRLDAPAEVGISYRSLAYYYTIEAILFFAALYFGIKLYRASREVKFAYVLFIGIGALIIAGVVDPRGAGKWNAIYLGVFVSLLYWLAGGICRKAFDWAMREIKRLREREHKPTATPPSPPAVPPDTAPEHPAI